MEHENSEIIYTEETTRQSDKGFVELDTTYFRQYAAWGILKVEDMLRNYAAFDRYLARHSTT